MSIDPQDNDLIERRLLGKLSDAEIRSFEERLDDDREFARKFRLISMFPEMMSPQGRLEYEQKLAAAAVPVEKKKTFPLPKTRYLVWAVISIVIITGIILLVFLIRSGHQEEKVASVENVVSPVPVPVKVAQPIKDTVKIQTEKKAPPVVPSQASNKAIQLLNPADGLKFTRNDMILFNWTQKTDTFTRFYIISEQHDQVVYWRGVRPGIREYKIPGSYLYPGKYFWYVGTKSEKRTFTISE